MGSIILRAEKIKITSGFATYGSLSTGCRICFSEDFHLHICHDEPLLLRRKAEKRMVELSHDEVRLMREALLAFG